MEGETQIAAPCAADPAICTCARKAPSPLPEALEAIRLADAIILGPGSVYTSIIPNLLVDGIADAIDKSRAVKIYVCNVMTQPGETDHFTASDHLQALARHAPGKRLFDYVLLNKQQPDADVLERYEKYGQRYVVPDVDHIRALGYTPVAVNLISQTDIVRHDPAKLTEEIYRIIL